MKFNIYWMSRDQRIESNQGLNHTIEQAKAMKGTPLIVFALAENFLSAGSAVWQFMQTGLEETAYQAAQQFIPMILIKGNVPEIVTDLINLFQAETVVTDFDPLKIKRRWQHSISRKIHCPLEIIDSHNTLPVTLVSEKKEYSAYTIRKKINEALFQLKPGLTALSDLLKSHRSILKTSFDSFFRSPDYEKLRSKKYFLASNNESHPLFLQKDNQSSFTDWYPQSGRDAAINLLSSFVAQKLDFYDQKAGDPVSDGSSKLSPYLHFGQISSLEIMNEIKNMKILSGIEEYKSDPSYQKFREQLIIRKELSDNFCYFEKNYDNTEGYPAWAKENYRIHENDVREYIYSFDQWEKGQTHDKYWNAAQYELILSGTIHGYMRMYWAKKILEWSESVESAHTTAVLLNDKWALDGRDPNGYTGIAWSLGGVHDRPWFERNVYGKIRYMNSNGLSRKFPQIEKYVNRWYARWKEADITI